MLATPIITAMPDDVASLMLQGKHHIIASETSNIITSEDVTLYKYIATSIGSAIAGLGGLYYVMDYANGVWSNNGFGDRGWLSIALVIFSVWRPAVSIIGSVLFGFLYVIPTYIPDISVSAKKLFEMLPYVVTIIVLIITENQPPAALGLPYFREER